MEILFEYGFDGTNGIIKEYYPINQIPFMKDESDSYWEFKIKYIRQFIGIMDIEGAMLFDGDIIQDKYDSSCKHVIKWFAEECCFGVLFIGLNDSLTPSAKITQLWVNQFDKIKIGNIHENPELLQQ